MPTNRIGTVAVPADLTTALTPQWLTAALQPRFPGTEVCSVARGPIVERLSTNARFAIDCAGEAPTDLPTRLCTPDWCVTHGDAHVGNLIRDRVGRPGLVDWQLVQRGRWQIDVGYLIAATLEPEQRRRSELELLRHYMECLSSYGIPVPSFDQARMALPDGMIHGFFLWSITTKVAPDVISHLLARLGTAVADHSTEVNP